MTTQSERALLEHPIAKLKRTGEWDRMGEQARLAFYAGSAATLLWALACNRERATGGIRA